MMKSPAGKWGMGALGVLVCFAVYLAFSNKHQTEEQYAAQQLAKHSGLDIKDINELFRLNHKVHDKTLTAQEWTELEKYSENPAIELRVTAELHMNQLKGTIYEPDMRKALYRLSEDTDPGIRLIALRELMWIKDPRSKEFLQEAAASPDKKVSFDANKMLAEAP